MLRLKISLAACQVPWKQYILASWKTAYGLHQPVMLEQNLAQRAGRTNQAVKLMFRPSFKKSFFGIRFDSSKKAVELIEMLVLINLLPQLSHSYYLTGILTTSSFEATRIDRYQC